MSELGDRVKFFRERLGLNPRQLSKLCAVSPETIYKIESGESTNVGLLKLQEIARALSVDVVELLDFGSAMAMDDKPKKGGLFAGYDKQLDQMRKRMEGEGYLKLEKPERHLVEVWRHLSAEQRKTVLTVAESYVGDLLKKSKGA